MKNICICGWHFVDDFYKEILSLPRDEYNITVVANKHHNFLEHLDVEHYVRENIGLEFGAYSFYLSDIWKKGDILFMHDDVGFRPSLSSEGIISSSIFKIGKIFAMDFDFAFIFDSLASYRYNDGKHGRLFFCKEGLAKILKRDGMWYDRRNKGIIEKNPDIDHNAGIKRLTKDLEKYKECKTGIILVPEIVFGIRGEIPTMSKVT